MDYYTKQYKLTGRYNQQLVFDENEKNLKILEEGGFVELLDELNEYDGYLGDEDVIQQKLLDMVPKKPKFEFDPQDAPVVKRKLKKVQRRKRRKRRKVVWVHRVLPRWFKRWFEWWWFLIQLLLKCILGFHPTN